MVRKGRPQINADYHRFLSSEDLAHRWLTLVRSEREGPTRQSDSRQQGPPVCKRASGNSAFFSHERDTEAVHVGVIPISELVQEHEGLIRKLHSFSFPEAAALIATLSLFPEFAANTIRIEALIQLAAVACHGKKKPNRDDLVRWLGALGPDATAVRMEDPVEDVFIGCVNSQWGSFRLFCGVVSDADYWIEQLLLFVDERTPFGAARNEVLALLSLGEAVANRIGLQRYARGSGTRAARIQLPRWKQLQKRYQALHFSNADLAALGIELSSLEAFCLSAEMRQTVKEMVLWNTAVDQNPIASEGNAITLIAPSCIARAVLHRLVNTIARGMGGWGDTFFQVATATTFVNEVLRKLDVEPFEFQPPPWPDEVPPMMPYFGQFDRDKAVIGLSYSAELTAAAVTPGGTDALSEGQQLALEKFVRDCAALLESDHGISAGLVLINLSAVNRLTTFRFTRDMPTWRVRMAMLPDWLKLMNTAECSAMRLWKLCNHELLFQQHQIEVLNLAGLLNLFAFWKRYDFQLIPHHVNLRELSFVNIDSDFSVAIRAEVRQSHDVHCVRSHQQDRWVRLMRHNVRPLFEEDDEIHLYADYNAVGEGKLIGYVPGRGLSWWLAVPPMPPGHEHRDLVFQLWNCILHWLGRVARTVEPVFPIANAQSIMVDVQMPDVLRWNLRDLETFQPLTELDVSVDLGKSISITMGEGFLGHFRTPKNDAEQRIVAALLSGAASIAGLTLEPVRLAELRAAVVPNEDARYFHLAEVNTLEVMLAADRKADPTFVAREDIAVGRVGLADLVGRPNSNVVEGINDCRTFLEGIVARVWERIEGQLRPFDRASVVAGCFTAVDEIARDAEHWNMTARSLLAMHSNTDNVHKVVSKRRSEREKATVCNRLAIEIAQYACASGGGRLFALAEHLAILGEITVLIELAHHRDAIAYGFMAPRIEIFPNGDLDVDERFYVQTLGRYLSRRSEDITRRAAANYESYFPNSPSAAAPAEPASSIAELEPVFVSEFGFTIDHFITLLHELTEFSLHIKAGGGQISASDLTHILQHCGFPERGIQTLFDRFVLPIRTNWDADLPVRCRPSDVFPWRFRRQLSLLTRPIVEIRSSPRTFFISVPQLERSLAYWLSNLNDGHFPRDFFSSVEMRRFIGETANRRGHEFAQAVGAVFRDVLYSCELEVEMTRLGAGKHAGLGDIDTLAWHATTGRVFAVECKRLQTALTPREVIQRLEDFRGSRQQKDSLGRHLRRCDWLSANLEAVSKFTGIASQRIWLTPLLVPSEVVPMQFFAEMHFPTDQVISFADLRAYLQTVDA